LPVAACNNPILAGSERYFETSPQLLLRTPMRDNGRRAQMFADETYTQLGGADSEIANHFGAASNLLLNLAHTETASEKRKAELRTIVSVLDIPAYLRDVPTRDTQDWAASIKYYFASSLTRERPPR
jgi:hypothetical protein